MKADLHLHSSRSDGTLSPGELADRALRQGLTLIAVTDHDVLRGSDELIESAPGIDVLPGTELSLRDMDGLHLLLYGRRPAGMLRERLLELRNRREDRAWRMLDKLAAFGMPIDRETLRSGSEGSVGRMHIARAMVAAGYASSTQEAFDRWIGNGRPAYDAGERMSMSEALDLAARCGWVPVLAHPYELKCCDSALLALVKGWQAQGLRGIEVYHPSAETRGYEGLDRMARSLGMLVTGGSDFHTPGNRHTHCEIGGMCRHWHRMEEDVAALLRAVTE